MSFDIYLIGFFIVFLGGIVCCSVHEVIYPESWKQEGIWLYHLRGIFSVSVLWMVAIPVVFAIASVFLSICIFRWIAHRILEKNFQK